jgi:hypothetical protein
MRPVFLRLSLKVSSSLYQGALSLKRASYLLKNGFVFLRNILRANQICYLIYVVHYNWYNVGFAAFCF